MNILQLQERLKDLPDNALMQEMQMPTGTAPQFLVLSELKRRKRMRDDYQRQEAANIQTVAEEAVTAAGVPATGIMQMSKAMAPKTNMAQNTSAAEAMPTQPTRMAQGGVVKMAEAGRVPMYSPAAAENLKARPGAMAGGVLNKVAALKVNYPDIYEQYKNDVYELYNIADMLFEPAVTPELTGLDEIKTDMTDKAAPFVPRIPMDTSGETRPISPNMTFLNQPIGLGRQLYDELSNKAGTLGVPDYKLQYEPAKPGEYFYKGNSYILEPDGTMYRRGKEKTKGSKGANIPVSDDLKNTIIAENVGRSVIENYGQPPTSNIAPAEKLIADQRDGAPVESVTSFVKNSAGQPIEVDPWKIASAQVTPTPNLTGFEDAARAADAQRMMEINKIPERITVPTLPSEDMGIRSLSGFGEVPQAPAMEGFTAPETDFSYAPGSPAETAAIRKFLADESSHGVMDANLSSKTIKDLGAVKPVYTESKDIVRNLVNKRAQEYLQSDMYTPPEQIYDLGPKGGIKYITEDPTERDRMFAETSQREFLERQADAEAADRRALELDAQRQAEQAAADRVGAKIASDQPEAPLGFLEELISSGAGKLGEFSRERADLAAARAADETAVDTMGGIVPFEQTELGRQKKAEEAAAQDIAEISGGTTTSGGAGGAGFGSLDSRIAKMLADRQKQAESDKWMALAYAGMEMMKPTATVGEGLGKAGQAGLAYLTQAKKGMQDFETDMLKLQSQLDIARTRAAGSTSGALTLNQYLSRGEDLITAGQKMLENAGTNADAAARGQDLIDRGMALISIATGGGSASSGGAKTVNIS